MSAPFLANLDEVAARTAALFKPPPRLRLSQWADEHFYLSSESSAEPGRWKTLPYQVGIMDALTDPAVEQVWVKKSARVGWTKIMNALAGFYLHYDPCPIMIVQPTLDDAEGYSKDEIAPMLRDVPVLAELIEDKARTSANTMLHKTLSNGAVLQLVGANTPTGFRRVSRKVVLFDEVDGYPPSAGDEGDQIKLGIKRSEYYWDRKIAGGSTPTIALLSRISRLFEKGDQRFYFVPCPHCGHKQVLKMARMKWPTGKPLSAVYMCEGCERPIEYRHQRDMVHAGDWVATSKEPFAGIASFHIWAAYSFSPNATWGQLAAEFVEATGGGAETLKTFVNTVLGEEWHDKGEAPDWERLYQRRDNRAPGAVPADVCFITVGVDVQKDRLMFEIVGWGIGKQSWSIDAGALPGDTSANDVWRQLSELLERSFVTADGRTLPVAMMAVDSGYNTQQVYGWCRRYPMNRVIAIKGMDRATVLIGAPSPVEVRLNGRKLARGYKIWPVSPNLGKSELYGWLRLPQPSSETDGAFPPGFCHFPEYGEDYFKQLTAEQLVPHRNRKGFTKLEWEMIPNRQNHYLDCRVYARAAAAVLGMDRLSDAEWLRLRGATVEETPQAVPLQASREDSADAPSARRRGGFLGDRRGFLGKRD